MQLSNQQWLEWRLDGIGGSDAAAVLGLSPWKTQYQLWHEKYHRIISKKKNSSMQRGHDLEEPCREKFEEMMNVSVFPQNFQHHIMHWIRGSFDGIDLDGSIAVEIKNPNKEDHLMAKKGKVPEYYYPQCQHLIKVKELKRIFYFSHFDGDYALVDVPKDEKFLDDYIPKAKDFWISVLTGNPPMKTDKDLIYVVDKKWQDSAERLKILLSRIKEDEKEVDLLKSSLIDIADGFNSIGFGISLQKSTCKGHIDMARLKEDYPDIDFESYRKSPYEKWTLREVEEEG